MTLKTYNAEQVASLLFVHENRVLEWAAAGELLGVKLGRAWVFREQDVESFLDRKMREQSMAGTRPAPRPKLATSRQQPESRITA